MSDNSTIEWTDATWNVVTGCTLVSAGCANCYAVKMTHRLGAIGQACQPNPAIRKMFPGIYRYEGLTVLNPQGKRHFNGTVRCHDRMLLIPPRWRKGSRQSTERSGASCRRSGRCIPSRSLSKSVIRNGSTGI